MSCDSFYSLNNDEVVSYLYVIKDRDENFNGKFLRNDKELESYLKGIKFSDVVVKRELIVGDGKVHALSMDLEIQEDHSVKTFIIDAIPKHSSGLSSKVQWAIERVFREENVIIYVNEMKLQNSNDGCKVFSLVNSEVLSNHTKLYKKFSKLNHEGKKVLFVKGSDLPAALLKNLQSLSSLKAIKKEKSKLWDKSVDREGTSLKSHLKSHKEKKWDSKKEKEIKQNRSLDHEVRKIKKELNEKRVGIEMNYEEICFDGMGFEVLDLLEKDTSSSSNIKIESRSNYSHELIATISESELPALPVAFRKIFKLSDKISFDHDLVNKEIVLRGDRQALIETINEALQFVKNQPSELLLESYPLSSCHALILTKHAIENYQPNGENLIEDEYEGLS